MEYLAFITGFVITIVIIIAVTQFKKDKGKNEEFSTKDKMYKAITILIYLIIAIIIITIIARLFFWSIILELVKG